MHGIFTDEWLVNFLLLIQPLQDYGQLFILFCIFQESVGLLYQSDMSQGMLVSNDNLMLL